MICQDLLEDNNSGLLRLIMLRADQVLQHGRDAGNAGSSGVGLTFRTILLAMEVVVQWFVWR